MNCRWNKNKNYQIFFNHSHVFVPLKEKMKIIILLSVCEVLLLFIHDFSVRLFHLLCIDLWHALHNGDLIEFEIQPRWREKLLRLLIAFGGWYFFRIVVEKQLSLRMVVLSFLAMVLFDVLQVLFWFDSLLYHFVPEK